MAKNKYLFLILFVFVFLALSASFVNALEVKDYPSLPGVTKPSDCTGPAEKCLPAFISYGFGFLIYLAGIIAAISFALGAVQYIISLDNPTASSSAKDRMKGSILGLLLALSSFIIIKTINPDLANIKLDPLPSLIPLPTLPIPGVYYYTETGCGGDFSSGHISSENGIDNKFAGKIRSIKVVKNTDSDPSYIVIFHQFGLDELGGCNRPIILIQSDNCLSVENPNNTESVDITPIRNNPGSPGDGITFYSEAHGYASGQLDREGIKYIPDWTIVPLWSLPASSIIYDYKDATNVSEDYKRVNKTFQDRPGSIQMTGNYLVALYSRDPSNANSLVCQTFEDAVPDLNAVPITTTGGSDLENVYIMPTK